MCEVWKEYQVKQMKKNCLRITVFPKKMDYFSHQEDRAFDS